MEPAAAAALLEDLADRALRSEFEPVVCLEAPEAMEVPAGLPPADGRSVYQRHGGTRYATRAQLAMEERMLAQARSDGVPRLARAQAAHALGADPARLEDALAGRVHHTQYERAHDAQDQRAHDAHGERTRTGLREDQAAAALAALTDGRRVSVINAPAGPVITSTVRGEVSACQTAAAWSSRSPRGAACARVSCARSRSCASSSAGISADAPRGQVAGQPRHVLGLRVRDECVFHGQLRGGGVPRDAGPRVHAAPVEFPAQRLGKRRPFSRRARLESSRRSRRARPRRALPGRAGPRAAAMRSRDLAARRPTETSGGYSARARGR